MGCASSNSVTVTSTVGDSRKPTSPVETSREIAVPGSSPYPQDRTQFDDDEDRTSNTSKELGSIPYTQNRQELESNDSIDVTGDEAITNANKDRTQFDDDEDRTSNTSKELGSITNSQKKQESESNNSIDVTGDEAITNANKDRTQFDDDEERTSNTSKELGSILYSQTRQELGSIPDSQNRQESESNNSIDVNGDDEEDRTSNTSKELGSITNSQNRQESESNNSIDVTGDEEDRTSNTSKELGSIPGSQHRQERLCNDSMNGTEYEDEVIRNVNEGRTKDDVIERTKDDVTERTKDDVTERTKNNEQEENTVASNDDNACSNQEFDNYTVESEETANNSNRKLSTDADERLINVIYSDDSSVANIYTELSPTELKSALLHGEINIQCPPTAKIVRIFTSSTFTDTKHERNALMEFSYPIIRDKCDQMGYDFQVVDMRWGIRDEMSNNHKTVEICLKELKYCHEVSTGPCFVSLYAQKYGWSPYPTNISKDEFELITSDLSKKETPVLNKWYKLDSNLIPPQFVIQPISAAEPGTKAFKQDNAVFREESTTFSGIIFDQAINKLSPNKARKYLTSVTEKETKAGLLNVKDEDVSKQCLWLKREIRDLEKQPDSNEKKEYADTYLDDVQSKKNKLLFNFFKDKKMSTKLPIERIKRFDVTWKQVTDTSSGGHKAYIKEFCEQFELSILQMIEEGVEERQKNELNDELLEEISKHAAYCKKFCQDFCGREELIKNIQEYLDKKSEKPLYITGKTGCGKSSLVAKIVENCWDVADEDKPLGVVIRFCGTTPASKTAKSTLTSIHDQMCKLNNTPNTAEKDVDYTTLCTKLKTMIGSVKKKMIIILDDIDSLTPPEETSNTSWIPDNLPECVKIIITVRSRSVVINVPTECKEIVILTFNEDEAEVILLHWLKLNGRTLNKKQVDFVRNILQRFRTPLMIKLIHEIVIKWTSFFDVESADKVFSEMLTFNDEQQALGCKIKELLSRLDKVHGRQLVAMAFGYITLARTGLTEKELIDLLSSHQEVLDSVQQWWNLPDKRIPLLLLLRLLRDVDAVVERKELDGLSVIMWSYEEFKKQIEKIYINTNRDALLTRMADYYSGTLKGLNSSEQNLRYIQKFSNSSVRKVNCLPWILTKLDATRLKESCICNLDFMVAKIKLVGVQSVINDISEAVETVTTIDMTDCSYIKRVIQISQTPLKKNPNQLAVQILQRIPPDLQDTSGELRLLCEQCRKPSFLTIATKARIQSTVRNNMTCCVQVHGGEDVLGLELTADGKTAITCGNKDNKCMLQFWNVDNGKPINEITLTGSPVLNTFLAEKEDTIVLVVTETCLSSYDTQKRAFRNKYEFNGDTPVICVGGEDRTMIGLFWYEKWILLNAKDLKTNCQPGKMNGLNCGKTSLSTGCTKYMAWTDTERIVLRVFDLLNKKERQSRRIYESHARQSDPTKEENDNDAGDTIDAMCFNYDNETILLSNQYNKFILFISATDLTTLQTLTGNNQNNPLSFNLFSEKFLYFPSKRNVVIIDLNNGKRTVLDTHPCHIKAAGVAMLGTTDSRVLTVGDDGNLRIWEYEDIQSRFTGKQKHDNKTTCRLPEIRCVLQVHNNSRYCVMHSVEDKIHYLYLWDVIEDTMIRKSRIQKPGIFRIQLLQNSDDGELNAILQDVKGKLYKVDIIKSRTQCLAFETTTVGDNKILMYQSEDEIGSFKVIRRNGCNAKTDIIGLRKESQRLVAMNINSDKAEILVDERCNAFLVNKEESILIAETTNIFYIFEIFEGGYKPKNPNKTVDKDIFLRKTDSFREINLLNISEDGKYIILLHGAKFIIYDHARDNVLTADLYNGINTTTPSIEIDDVVFLSEVEILCSFRDGTTRIISLTDGKTRHEHKQHNCKLKIDGSLASVYYMTYGDEEFDQTVYIWNKEKHEIVASFTSDTELCHITLGSDGQCVIAGVAKPCCAVQFRVTHDDSNSKHPELSMKKNVFETETDVKDIQLKSADRSGADRSGADRSGADRSSADRSGADRSGADRSGADGDKDGGDKDSSDGDFV